MRLRDIQIGMEFNHLAVRGVYWRIKGRASLPSGWFRQAVVLCQCVCGKRVSIEAGAIPRQKSCGCKKPAAISERMTTHGLTNHSAYKSWESMIARCYDSSHDSYKNYGGRGITVSAEWHDVSRFVEDMGDRPTGFSIDRIDCDGNYEKSNCRWADAKTQHRNRRNNRILEVDGERMIMEDACNKFDISKHTFSSRVKRGWSVDEALKTPVWCTP